MTVLPAGLHETLGPLGHGLQLTLAMTAIAFTGALGLGVLLAVCRISPVPPLRALGTAYVTVFRNVPLLVLLVLFVFGLPDVGLLFSLFATVTLTMALYWAAFICEVLRAGIRTVPLGQAEAARALGLTATQSIRHIILPQALRSMVQPLANVFIAVALSTSLAAAVGVAEMTGQAQFVTLKYDQPLTSFAATTVVYVLITLTSGLIAGRIERKVAIRR
ncbi:amino acid ABC transporter permease [Kitasatospora sp. NBC_01250]|uniref:amino acid ABC transporter permease n=1 Tax=unclassified Kitasatospora TaxID=2633591 RepID=UPI002E14ECFB|nr:MULTISPECIES: amino acid ABC transporter permease [unclassified Kitasatospora]WSJ66550.1 amino acid ABC transporter permease [Kitasatospora sp. NBC_01302]